MKKLILISVLFFFTIIATAVILPHKVYSQSTTTTVAASNADASFKSSANYVADGTNDQVEIQQAIDSLGINGGTVNLSSGTFNLSISVFIKQKITLKGQGDITILKATGGLSGQIIRINGSNSQVATMIVTDGRSLGQSTSTHGVFIYSGDPNIRIEEVKVEQIHVKDLRSTNEWSDGISAYKANIVEIKNSIVENVSGSGIVLADTDNSVIDHDTVSKTATHGILSTQGSGNTISNNNVSLAGATKVKQTDFSHGIAIDGNSGLNPNSNHKIINNIINNSCEGGIEVADSVDNVLISGNTVNGAGICANPKNTNGIYFGGGLTPSKIATISGNKVTRAENNGIEFGSIPGHDLTTDVVVEGNETYNNGSSGIFANYAENYIIRNNSCYNNDQRQVDQDGIRLEDSSYGVVNNNHCYDNQVVKTQNNGLVFMNTIHDIYVYNNNFQGNQFGEIYTDSHATTSNIRYAVPISGDINYDGKVNIFDYNILLQNFGNTTCDNVADINGSCKVDIFDYNTLVQNFGKTQ